ncbi:MAG: hypothetical protein AAGA10_20245 [Bacteroidota bacterium]
MRRNENMQGVSKVNLKEEKSLWKRKGYNIARSCQTAPHADESLEVQLEENALREKEEREGVAKRYEEERKALSSHLEGMDKRLYALRVQEEKRKDILSKLKFSLLDRKNRREEWEKKLVATYEDLGHKRASNPLPKSNPLKKSRMKLYKALMQKARTHLKNPAHAQKGNESSFLITHVDAHLFPNLVRSIETLEERLRDNKVAIEDLEFRLKELEQNRDPEYVQIQKERQSLLSEQKACFKRLEEIPQRILEDQQIVGAIWQKRNQWILEGAQAGSFFNDGNLN